MFEHPQPLPQVPVGPDAKRPAQHVHGRVVEPRGEALQPGPAPLGRGGPEELPRLRVVRVGLGLARLAAVTVMAGAGYLARPAACPAVLGSVAEVPADEVAEFFRSASAFRGAAAYTASMAPT